MEPQVETWDAGVKQIISTLEKRIGRSDFVTLTQVASVAGTSEPEAIVYDPTSPSKRSTGTPLVIMVLCADAATWPLIEAAFRAEGFEPVTPEPDQGRVFYRSRTRALLIVPANPEATRAVDRTGRALLTQIV